MSLPTKCVKVKHWIITLTMSKYMVDVNVGIHNSRYQSSVYVPMYFVWFLLSRGIDVYRIKIKLNLWLTMIRLEKLRFQTNVRRINIKTNNNFSGSKPMNECTMAPTIKTFKSNLLQNNILNSWNITNDKRYGKPRNIRLWANHIH